jgi:hypothetical protein
MNFRGWCFMLRQEYAIMRTTYEDPIKIECAGPTGAVIVPRK